MNENCLLNLVVTPEAEDAVADWLLDREEVSGFSSMPIAGHGSSEHAMSLAEQVAGRRRQVLFQIHLGLDDARRLVTTLGEDFHGSGMHFWLTPVLDSGHVA
ncbi:MAG: DUF3240 family protein [Gammaproteobacteria bacterium]|nr:DUF3240 family protein [Gammaproteobacteria bacterium]